MEAHRSVNIEFAHRRRASGHALSVGRVGALALMLGVGSALAWAPVALADTIGSAESAASPVASTSVTSAAARPRTAATRMHSRSVVGTSSSARQHNSATAGSSAGSGSGSARSIRGDTVTAAPSPASDATGDGSAAAPLLGTATELTNRASRRMSHTATPAASTTSAPPLAFATASALGGFTLPVGPIRAAIIAAQAYIYGYPILAVQRVQSLLGPLNTMNINTSFASADAAPFWKAIGGGSRPNVNVLYSLASLDLSNGPVVLSIPNMGDRYYSFQLNDPYIDVDNYISSNPTAANPIGGPGPGRYAITWIGNNVDVPGAQKVLVNYSSELMLGRVEATTADQQEVVDLMEQWTLTPTGATSTNNAVLPSAYLSPISVLNAISLAMTQNPAYPTDTYASELAKLAQIGVGPDPNDPTTALQVQGTLGPISQLAAAISTQIAAILLPPLTDLTQKLSAFQHHGWAVTKSNIGDYGTDYLYRAGVALVGLVANTPDQALYFPGLLDSTYLPLKGNRTYLIHYAPGQAPPIDDGGFWSLTVYNSDGTLVDSSTLNVYSNGPVVINPDGSIDVILSQVDPGDPNSNWLQTPTGDFSVYLRIYAPGQAAADGTWLPQPIQRTSGLFG